MLFKFAAPLSGWCGQIGTAMMAVHYCHKVDRNGRYLRERTSRVIWLIPCVVRSRQGKKVRRRQGGEFEGFRERVSCCERRRNVAGLS